MYEQFGFNRTQAGDQIQLFVPDNAVDPTQYTGFGPCRIVEVRIVSDFLSLVGAGANWDYTSGLLMTKKAHPNGFLFQYDFPHPLPDGYYQYCYVVQFEDHSVRWVGDPCSKYGGDSADRSAFVVGGTKVAASNFPNRLSTEKLLIYELMIDDFTKNYRTAGQAPLDAVVEKLDYVKSIGVNAVEFMPWIAWPDDVDFSWGYNPAFFFSVESAYMSAAGNPLDRLSRLGNLVSECHKRGLQVILDIVLQHALQGSTTNGFPYYWLWQKPGRECPFVGQFVNADNFGMLPLNYNDGCTQQFVGDVCKYWMDRFNLDGFRFDQVTGYNNPNFPKKGAPGLIADLSDHITATGRDNFALMLEGDWGYQAVDDANKIKPTSTWFDVFRSVPFGLFSGYADQGQTVQTPIMRVFNSAFQFNSPITPTIYIENHDHASVTERVGSRDNWYKTQPWMIALATCSGAVLIHNGQEYGQFEDIWEDDSHADVAHQRVQSRPLDWGQAGDALGTTMIGLYNLLLKLRAEHPGLTSPNFYPDTYDQTWTAFSPDGYGLHVGKQVAIYHRYGENTAGNLERFIVVLNFSGGDQYVDIPFPFNGTWTDLINGNGVVGVGGYRLSNYRIPSNWGCLFFQ